jgi:hypothetical protein
MKALQKIYFCYVNFEQQVLSNIHYKHLLNCYFFLTGVMAFAIENSPCLFLAADVSVDKETVNIQQPNFYLYGNSY